MSTQDGSLDHAEVHCAKMHTANADYALQSTIQARRWTQPAQPERASERVEKPFFTASRLEMSDGPRVRGSDL